MGRALAKAWPSSLHGSSWRGCPAPVQTAEDCLMLWKLTRVGDVGMDMARATRARIECLSCQRCHLFRMAERTWGTEQSLSEVYPLTPNPRAATGSKQAQGCAGELCVCVGGNSSK